MLPGVAVGDEAAAAGDDFNGSFEKTIAVTPFDRLRAEAAVAIAEGDRDGARERIERARAVMPANDACRREWLRWLEDAASPAEPATA